MLRRIAIFVVSILLICACRTSKSVQVHTESHHISDNVNSVGMVSVVDSYASHVNGSALSNHLNIDADIVHIVEMLDSSGHVTQRENTIIKLHADNNLTANDSSITITNLHSSVDSTHVIAKNEVIDETSDKQRKLIAIRLGCGIGIMMLFCIIMMITYIKIKK